MQENEAKKIAELVRKYQVEEGIINLQSDETNRFPSMETILKFSPPIKFAFNLQSASKFQGEVRKRINLCCFHYGTNVKTDDWIRKDVI